MSNQESSGPLNPAERQALYSGLLAEADLRYANDCNLWLRNQVWTLDEATEQKRRWPTDKPYIQEIVQALDECRLLAIPKSRRMMVSWIVAAWCTHRARYRPANAIYWQSETEDKAAFVVDQRCRFIEDNLQTPALRKPYSTIKTTQGQVGRLTYDRTKSYIRAVAQGDSVIRGFTPTVLVMDECEFQPEAAKALEAALATAEKDSHLILVSSSNGPRGILASMCAEIGFTKFG